MVSAPLKGGAPAGFLVSKTRHGGNVNSDNPPTPGAAKYPFTSITKSVLFEANTDIAPFVPAGTIAAFAVVTPVGAFNVETGGCACPAGHAATKPRAPCGTAVKFR